MAETILKPKMQIRSPSATSNGSANGGDKTPTTPSKLMINHGKPNFTIQRSPKANGDDNPLLAELANKNNNYNAYKSASSLNYSNSINNNVVISTKFNGAFKPTNLAIPSKQAHQSDDTENEAAKVVLRRAKVAEPENKDDDQDASVPEFIRRQRRIQERLAKENILDFENRRSGYFTHVLISPSSPTRKSFVETMSSPAIVPALEIPPPAFQTPEQIKEEEPEEEPVVTNGNHNGYAEHVEHEEHGEVGEDEVARAIEEVNKAVAGEDDDKPFDEPVAESWHPVAATWEHIEEPVVEHKEHVVEEKLVVETQQTQHPTTNDTNEGTIVAAVGTVATNEQHETDDEVETPKQNGHIEVEVHATQENGDGDITISHTNGFDGPSIPSPDPSGNLGVNYEPKTVVSFSKDLGSEPNRYPDTVKVVNGNGEAVDAPKTPVSEELQELSKLKFDIKTDEQNVEVTPVLRAE